MTTFENVKESMKEKRHRQDARLGHALAMDERARPGSRQSRQMWFVFAILELVSQRSEVLWGSGGVHPRSVRHVSMNFSGTHTTCAVIWGSDSAASWSTFLLGARRAATQAAHAAQAQQGQQGQLGQNAASVPVETAGASAAGASAASAAAVSEASASASTSGVNKEGAASALASLYASEEPLRCVWVFLDSACVVVGGMGKATPSTPQRGLIALLGCGRRTYDDDGTSMAAEAAERHGFNTNTTNTTSNTSTTLLGASQPHPSLTSLSRPRSPFQGRLPSEQGDTRCHTRGVTALSPWPTQVRVSNVHDYHSFHTMTNTALSPRGTPR